MPPVVYDDNTIQELEADFIAIAYRLFKGRTPSSSHLVNDRRLRAWCGCSPTVIAKVWNLLDRFGGLEQEATRDRLLWALHLLTSYNNTETSAAFCKADEKTFRRWAWYFIEEISYLENFVILWENRRKVDIGNTCMASVDGADFRVKGEKLLNGEPDPAYYSYKFKAPGLRYMVALSILSTDIVFVAGPYLPGLLNDLQIFRISGIKDEMELKEKVEADDGYMGECPAYVSCPGWHSQRTDQKRLKSRVRMRHEHVNTRMKNFKCMVERFRHPVAKHASCFRAVAVVTQLAMENGEPMIDMSEYDDRLTDLQIHQIFGI